MGGYSFTTLGNFKTFCSKRCRRAFYYYESNPESRHPLDGFPECVACGEEFFATRSDADYCSNACRQWAYRERLLSR